MKLSARKLSSVTVAMAAAGLLSACAETQVAKTAATNTAELAHCYDINVCKGHNDCKTAENACAGQASCKGHGFVAMSSKACADVGGKIQDDFKGTSNAADMTHCYGVNKCGGHNDCKTANNACAGKASCTGKGFVSMSAKACKSIGGKTEA